MSPTRVFISRFLYLYIVNDSPETSSGDSTTFYQHRSSADAHAIDSCKRVFHLQRRLQITHNPLIKTMVPLDFNAQSYFLPDKIELKNLFCRHRCIYFADRVNGFYKFRSPPSACGFGRNLA